VTNLYARAKFLLRNPEELRKMLLNAIGKAYAQRRLLTRVFSDLMLLFRLVRAWVRGEYRDIPRKSILWAVFAILYFLSPIDLIPDFLPGGYIDDMAVIAFVCNRIRGDLDDFLEWEKARKPAA
jgi:uncharacterized membrane protein YkvA (DUF1232 family)